MLKIILELYLRRYKKEKRLRRQIQDQLDEESIKKAKLEEALSAVSYQTYVQLKDESWFTQLRRFSSELKRSS